MIPTPKGFLGSGQPTGLPPKPDLSRYAEPARYAVKDITPSRAPEVTASAPVPASKPPSKPRQKRRPPSEKPPPTVRVGNNRHAILEVLHEQGEAMSIEAVALECHRRWPDRFGMKTAREHPCTNAVYARLAQLTTEGFVVRPTVGTVQITIEGASAYMMGVLFL